MMHAALRWLPPSKIAATHEMWQKRLMHFANLEHRGASGAEPDSGDGAGILIRVPDALLSSCHRFSLPAAGSMRQVSHLLHLARM
jgi:glutamate synthase domain-containing protein 1